MLHLSYTKKAIGEPTIGERSNMFLSIMFLSRIKERGIDRQENYGQENGLDQAAID